MSSDYGSDILSDDIGTIDDSPNVQPQCAPAATPRLPLTPHDANIPVTPPPSQSQSQSRSVELCPPSSLQPLPQSSSYHSRLQKYGAPATPESTAKPVEFVGPYRFTFGQYRGKTVEEVPQSFVVWLNKNDAPNRPPALKAALDDWDNRQAAKQPRTPLSQSSPALSSQPLPSTAYISSSQPTPISRSYKVADDNRHSLDEPLPLYRLPFGIHKGKTLLEVPEQYIAYLRVDQNMTDMMTGLGGALRLLDEGKLPVANRPPLASQPPIIDITPTSVPNKSLSPQPPHAKSTPSRTSSIPQMSQTGPASSQTPSNDGCYRLNFGLHTGKTLHEVATEYISFLIERGIGESRPELAIAIVKYERERPAALAASQSNNVCDPAQYKLTFGKHSGKRLCEVPVPYVEWMRDSNLGADYPALRSALDHHAKTQAEMVPKKKKVSTKRKAPTGISSGWGGGGYLFKRRR
jgi:uncharacterized protein (DUF3820 family)